MLPLLRTFGISNLKVWEELPKEEVGGFSFVSAYLLWREWLVPFS